MKDRFSQGSADYAQFRPGYPADLVAFVMAHVVHRRRAWDVGTGNGQMAQLLAPWFESVEATDISAAQLAAAPPLPNVRYRQLGSTGTDFPDGHFDLVTVAQAIHWFDFEGFYAEVRRVAAPGALLAVAGYPLLGVDAADVDAVLKRFYVETLQGYWDAERRHLDARYRSIPFPFEEIPCPEFESRYEWTLAQFIGYLGTWSAVRNHDKATGLDAIGLVRDELHAAWGERMTVQVTFPMILRLGRVG